jgi:hypothetical protein
MYIYLHRPAPCYPSTQKSEHKPQYHIHNRELQLVQYYLLRSPKCQLASHTVFSLLLGVTGGHWPVMSSSEPLIVAGYAGLGSDPQHMAAVEVLGEAENEEDSCRVSTLVSWFMPTNAWALQRSAGCVTRLLCRYSSCGLLLVVSLQHLIS